MNKYLLTILFTSVFCTGVFAQLTEEEMDRKIADYNSQANRIESCNKVRKKYGNGIVDFRYVGGNNVQIILNPYINFIRFCEDYRLVMIDFDIQNADKNSETPLVHIIIQSKNKNETNIYRETIPQRPKITIESLRPKVTPVTPSARPQVTKLTEEQIKYCQSEIDRLEKSQKQYQDLSNVLQHQIKNNAVEIADMSGDLLVKHIPNPLNINDDLKEKAMEELRKYTGTENFRNKNTVADIINNIVDGTDKILELVPAGDIIANDWRYRIFKSLPEVGKILGNAPAMINIYFRKKEYDDKIQEIEIAKQQVKQLCKDK